MINEETPTEQEARRLDENAAMEKLMAMDRDNPRDALIEAAVWHLAGIWAPTLENVKEATEMVDAFAHALAEKIRSQVELHCVNDTDEDGGCWACVRNPKALCRQPTPEGRGMLRAADLIDPEVET